MAHYAFIDEDNMVTQVIVGRDENDLVEGVTDWESYYSERHGQRCLRTSYNTSGNQHKFGGVPFRGNYAGIGFTYHKTLDAFIPPKPFESWLLNEQTFLWHAPVAYPTDGESYNWNENTLAWDLEI